MLKIIFAVLFAIIAESSMLPDMERLPIICKYIVNVSPTRERYRQSLLFYIFFCAVDIISLILFSCFTSLALCSENSGVKNEESQLGDTEFANLLFLWYDEVNNEFVELETVCDEENSTVSVETTHFSKYMIVDSKKWFDAWATKLDYDLDIPGIKNKAVYKTVLTISCSDTMKYNDPVTSYKYMEGPYSIVYRKTCKRIKIVDSFINKMSEKDRVSIVTVSYLGGSIRNSCVTKNDSNLQDELKKMHEYGFGDQGTVYFEDAITRSIFGAFYQTYPDEIEYENRIILISDGYFYMPSSRDLKIYLDIAKNQKKKIYTFGVGTHINEDLLKYISDYTGGKYYKLSTLDELNDIYEEIGFGCNFDTIDTTDTDGDGLYDVVEKAGIRLQNGKIIRGCDPNKKDTDEDGLSDGEEIDPEPRYYSNTVIDHKTNEILHVKGYSFKMKSNPINADTDGDGLLDGKRQYYESRIIAPIDPEPLNYTGEKGLWQLHTLLLNKDTNLKNNFSKGYADKNKYFDIILEKGKLICTNREAEEVGVNRAGLGALLSGIGSYTLSFTYDDEHIALHSDSKQWQINFGYNDFYDWAFDKATSMNKMKLDFELDGKPYVVWAWKGNYLNLGPGAEIGVYTQDEFLKKLKKLSNIEHWKVGNERFPMTISLYKKNFDSNKKFKEYSNYFNWMYGQKQWWATGFVPNIEDLYSVTEDELIQISSIDFHDNPKMLAALKKEWENSEYAKNLIFDMGVNRLWIMW